jgi:DNA-binding NarL/FixJ family response regulator
MSEDEANRMIYEARLKAQRDEYSRIRGAREEGRKEIILQMAKHGMTGKDIAAVTHTSEQEVNGILGSPKD